MRAIFKNTRHVLWYILGAHQMCLQNAILVFKFPIYLFSYFWWNWGWNSWLHALLLEPHLWSILLQLFWRRGSLKPGLALNHDPPDLSFPALT
jgi:hypothetical protein